MTMPMPSPIMAMKRPITAQEVVSSSVPISAKPTRQQDRARNHPALYLPVRLMT